MKYRINTEIIINFMLRNNLSKTKFCQMCNISPRTLKKIMVQDYNFGITKLFRIAKVINVQVYEMFSQDELS